MVEAKARRGVGRTAARWPTVAQLPGQPAGGIPRPEARGCWQPRGGDPSHARLRQDPARWSKERSLCGD